MWLLLMTIFFVFQNDTRLSSGYDFLAFDEAGQPFDALEGINLDDLLDGMETCA